MKEAIVNPDTSVTIRDTDVPKPKADQVLIKVVVSGSNPKDWKLPQWTKKPQNSGDDIAGIVESVGENVMEFKPGDRVAAFHQMTTEHGSFAEYAIALATTTFHIPAQVSFEEASTIPLAAITAAVGLFYHLDLPQPYHPATTKTPLIVYGGSSAVGAFAIKLANAANIHPIITTAGKGSSFVESLLDPEKGDVLIDYRKGKEATVSAIQDALKKAGLDSARHAFDAIAEHESHEYYMPVLSKEGSIVTHLLPINSSAFPSYVKDRRAYVGMVHGDPPAELAKTMVGDLTSWQQFGFIFTRLFSLGLSQGWFTPHPYTVISGGLNSVEKALKDLKEGKASATKFVFRIAETS